MDLQDSGSTIDLAIDKVGIVELEKKVEIVQEKKNTLFTQKSPH
jgi:GTP cyclohydrolase FolE2